MPVKPINGIDEFDQVIKNGLVVVDFFATWCGGRTPESTAVAASAGPCKMIKPFLDQKSDVMPNINFYSVNVDDNPDLCEREEVSAMPTFKLYKDGKLVQTIVGVMKPKLEEAINNLA